MRVLATRVLIAKILADHIVSVLKDDKAELSTQMQPGDRVAIGTEALGHDTELGTVTMTKGRRNARVVDRRAFTTWVADRHRSEVAIEVRPAFERRILDVAMAEGVAVDRETGEIIPGVEIIQGEPYLMAKSTDDARGVLAAWLEKRLELRDQPDFVQPDDPG